MSTKRFLTVALLLMAPLTAGGQSGGTGPGVPRTPWGDPNLQGVWDYWTFTPLERPEEFAAKAVLTEQEAVQYAAPRARQMTAGQRPFGRQSPVISGDRRSLNLAAPRV